MSDLAPTFRLDFSTNFETEKPYLRNNKADGEKNIRCFPQCKSSGHCRIGFCGSSICCVLTAKK